MKRAAPSLALTLLLAVACGGGGGNPTPTVEGAFLADMAGVDCG